MRVCGDGESSFSIQTEMEWPRPVLQPSTKFDGSPAVSSCATLLTNRPANSKNQTSSLRLTGRDNQHSWLTCWKWTLQTADYCSKYHIFIEPNIYLSFCAQTRCDFSKSCSRLTTFISFCLAYLDSNLLRQSRLLACLLCILPPIPHPSLSASPTALTASEIMKHNRR